jgi:hypothetical protein
MNTTTFVGFAALAVVVAGGWWYYTTSQPMSPEPEQVFCTADAMECPDGSYVGRTGPNCEFVCPEEGVAELGGTVLGTVMLGPSCPVESYPPDPNCADKPYATSLVLTTLDGARVLKQFDSNTDGTFRVEVMPGTYAIRSAASANILPYCQVDNIVVPPNGFAEVVVSCDSGIR